jgi:hypothetical protein
MLPFEPRSELTAFDEFLSIVEEIKKCRTPDKIHAVSKEPSKTELEYLIRNCRNEIGLHRLSQNKKWQLIEGDEESVLTPEFDALLDLSAHSHPGESFALPSFKDLLYINQGGSNFVIGEAGITFFSKIQKHPLSDQPWDPRLPQIKRAALSFAKSENKDFEVIIRDYSSYRKFLGKSGVTIVSKSWRQLPEYPISGFPLKI